MITTHFIIKNTQTRWTWFYLNKMIVIHMTNTLTRCIEQSLGCWLLKGKNIKLCWRERETRMTLYLWCNHITHVGYIYPLIRDNLHVTVLIRFICWKLIHQNITNNLYIMDNPSISSDHFNYSNLSMPLSRLIYSSNHFASSLSKWL